MGKEGEEEEQQRSDMTSAMLLQQPRDGAPSPSPSNNSKK
jgi:hypothetical protein